MSHVISHSGDLGAYPPSYSLILAGKINGSAEDPVSHFNQRRILVHAKLSNAAPRRHDRYATNVLPLDMKQYQRRSKSPHSPGNPRYSAVLIVLLCHLRYRRTASPLLHQNTLPHS